MFAGTLEKIYLVSFLIPRGWLVGLSRFICGVYGSSRVAVSEKEAIKTDRAASISFPCIHASIRGGFTYRARPAVQSFG